jgi:energy-coupling factor transporter ATP-binding protein EcfA2
LNDTEGLTVILVTHDLQIALQAAKRALVLIDGEVVADTTDFTLAAEMLHRKVTATNDGEH